MLGEFVQTTGYTRKYAIHLLNSWGRTRLVQIDGQMVKLVVGRPRRAKRRARPRRYDQEVLKALKQIWYVFDFMCAKRLVVVLCTMLAVLDSFGEIPLTAEVRAKLLSISAATIDRLLQRERARLSLKGRSHTKPGTLLKHQIPIRTFADWNEQEPGFFLFRQPMAAVLEQSFGVAVQQRTIAGEQFDILIHDHEHILVEIAASVGALHQDASGTQASFVRGVHGGEPDARHSGHRLHPQPKGSGAAADRDRGHRARGRRIGPVMTLQAPSR